MKKKLIKLPKEIHVGARTYKVMDLRHYEHDDNCGDTCPIKQEIRIYQLDDDARTELQELDTLTHEILHAGCAAYGNPFTFAQEERAVNFFARVMADVFLNNPDLMRYYKETLTRIRRR